jgi:hypothetical protein
MTVDINNVKESIRKVIENGYRPDGIKLSDNSAQTLLAMVSCIAKTDEDQIALINYAIKLERAKQEEMKNV